MRKKVNQAEIATAAGVSVSTVSRVLSGAHGISEPVRASVSSIAERLGYPFASIEPKNRLTKAVAYLADSHGVAIAPAYEPVLQGLREATSAAGLHLGVVLRERAGKLPPQILKDPTVGAFLIGLDPSESMMDRIVDAGIPAVLVNGLDPDLRIDAVAPANFFGGRLAARHLADHGHRRFLHVAWKQRWTLRRRAHGLRDGVGEYTARGLEMNLETLEVPTLDEADVCAAMERRITTGPLDFTAVVCGNDVAAICAMQTLGAHGIEVPKQVSVMGFDDVSVAAMSNPPLTTIRADWRLIGHEAVRLMIQRRTQPDAIAMQMQTAMRLVSRESVRRI